MTKATDDWKLWAKTNAEELELWKAVNQQAREDIARYKQQQWQVTYFGFLIYGALITLSNGLPGAHRCTLGLLALLVGVVGSLVVWDLHGATERSRAKGNEAVCRFESDLRRLEKAVGKMHRSLSNKALTVVLVLGSLFGAVVTFLLSLCGG